MCIKDHVRSSINDFRERIRAITNPSFAVGCLRKKKKMMNNPGFYKFPRFTVAVYFTYFESIKVYKKALSEHVVCLKRLKTSAFGSSEPLLLLRLMGVSAPSLHIESTDSMICV